MRKILLSISSIFILATALISCSDESGYEYGDFRFDMVTFTGNDNGRATFALIQRDDAGEVTLITADSCYLDASSGQRMLLNYIPSGTQSAGMQTINARGYTTAFTDTLRQTNSINVISLVMDSIRLKSIWRTGCYINLSSEVKYTGESRTLGLVMDYGTAFSDTVHCYLAHDMRSQTAYFWRQNYASFYIGAIWKLSSCKTVRVHLNDVIYPDKTYYDFTKTE